MESPQDHGVHLAIEGNDRIATQSVTLNSGAPEQRPESDATYRSLVRNVKPGEEAVLPLSPAQIFEGVVRFEDTGVPARSCPADRLFDSQQVRTRKLVRAAREGRRSRALSNQSAPGRPVLDHCLSARRRAVYDSKDSRPHAQGRSTETGRREVAARRPRPGPHRRIKNEQSARRRDDPIHS